MCSTQKKAPRGSPPPGRRAHRRPIAPDDTGCTKRGVEDLLLKGTCSSRYSADTSKKKGGFSATLTTSPSHRDRRSCRVDQDTAPRIIRSRSRISGIPSGFRTAATSAPLGSSIPDASFILHLVSPLQRSVDRANLRRSLGVRLLSALSCVP